MSWAGSTLVDWRRGSAGLLLLSPAVGGRGLSVRSMATLVGFDSAEGLSCEMIFGLGTFSGTLSGFSLGDSGELGTSDNFRFGAICGTMSGAGRFWDVERSTFLFNLSIQVDI